MIFHRTVGVPRLNDYREYRDAYLRPDFRCRCAYCLTHEFYFLLGDGGEVDHHRPLKAKGQDFDSLRNDYGNLYWTCGQCNREKGDHWPSNQEYADGSRFLDPCVEDHDDHWDTHADGTVTAKTSIGRFTIRYVRLDRKRLTDLRRFLHAYQRKVAAIESELNRRHLTSQQRAALAARLSDIKPIVDPPLFDR